MEEATNCNLRHIKLVNDRCSDTEGQHISAKFSEKNSSTLYREMNFSWGKKNCVWNGVRGEKEVE